MPYSGTIGVPVRCLKRLEIDAMESTYLPEKYPVNVESGVYGETWADRHSLLI